jgi:hypothetical protein
MGSVITAITSWVNAPFTTPLNVKDLFLMTGLCLVFILAWLMILYHVRLAAETL